MSCLSHTFNSQYKILTENNVVKIYKNTQMYHLPSFICFQSYYQEIYYYKCRTPSCNQYENIFIKIDYNKYIFVDNFKIDFFISKEPIFISKSDIIDSYIDEDNNYYSLLDIDKEYIEIVTDSNIIYYNEDENKIYDNDKRYVETKNYTIEQRDEEEEKLRLKYISNFSNFEIYDSICKILINSNSIIAGGCNLSLIHNDKINDIDIYVCKSNIDTIVIDLLNLGYKVRNEDSFFVSAYDNSFFRKNDILARFPFTKKNNPDIDLLIINDDNILNVVKNFDLSFCKTYFDGNQLNFLCSVYGVINKCGILSDEYFQCIYYNKFIQERSLKYISRGYTILNADPEYLYEENEEGEEEKKYNTNAKYSRDIPKDEYELDKRIYTKINIFNNIIYYLSNKKTKKANKKYLSICSKKILDTINNKYEKYFNIDNIKLYSFIYFNTRKFFNNDLTYDMVCLSDFFELNEIDFIDLIIKSYKYNKSSITKGVGIEICDLISLKEGIL